MWGYVKDNKVEEIIRFPKTIVIDDIKHPRAIFNTWTWEQLNATGLYEVVDSGTKGDDKFEYTSQPTYTFSSKNKNITTSYTITEKALDDSEAKDEDGKNILDEDGNKVINYGLKTLAKNQAKKTAHNLIKRFGWLVQRVTMDSSATIPSAVTTYCAAIRKDCDDICTAIDNASDMDGFKALYADELNSDGSIKTVARINRWTSDSTVTDYIR